MCALEIKLVIMRKQVIFKTMEKHNLNIFDAAVTKAIGL